MLPIAFKLLFIAVAGSAVVFPAHAMSMEDSLKFTEEVAIISNKPKDPNDTAEVIPTRCNCNLPECLATNGKDIRVCTSTTGCFVSMGTNPAVGPFIFGCKELMPIDAKCSTPNEKVTSYLLYKCCNNDYCNNLRYVFDNGNDNENKTKAQQGEDPIAADEASSMSIMSRPMIELINLKAYIQTLEHMFSTINLNKTSNEQERFDRDVTTNSPAVASAGNVIEKDSSLPYYPLSPANFALMMFANSALRETEKLHRSENTPGDITTEKTPLDLLTGSMKVNAATNELDSVSASALPSTPEIINFKMTSTPIELSESKAPEKELIIEIIPKPEKWFGARDKRSVTTEENVKPSEEPAAEKKVVPTTPAAGGRKRPKRCIALKTDEKSADIGFGIGLCG